MADRACYEKSTCAVAGCTSWSRCFPGEWLCARHWRLVRPALRRALRKSWRIPFTKRVAQQEARLWRHALRQATLKAAGL